MNNKAIIVLTALTFTVVVLVLVFGERTSDTTENDLNINFEELNIENVHRVEFTRGEEALTLDKNDNGWYVGEDFAEQSIVTAFFEAVRLAEVTETAATNPDFHERFEVDDALGLKVLFYANGDNFLEDFFIGKFSNGGSYLRDVDGEKVYRVSANLDTYRNLDPTYWLPAPDEIQEEAPVTE